MRLTEFLKQVNKYDFLVERDVLNAGEIKKWVSSISGRVRSDQAQKWFQSQLYQYIINRYEDPRDVKTILQVPDGSPDWLIKKLNSGEAIYSIEASTGLSEQVMPVIDYINDWSEDNPGREPRMRWEQAVEQSKAWHREMKNVSVSAEENEKDIEEISTIYELKNGYKWVDLGTEACLKREGNRMGHCVGGYWQEVAAGTTKIFSLRDTKNIPHATIEATAEEPTVIIARDDAQRDMFGDGGNIPPLTIEQVKGRSNKPPVAKYVSYVKEFLEWGNFKVNRGMSDIQSMGLYRKNEKYHTMDEVSKDVKKYKDGTKWVKIDNDVEFEYTGSPYHLLDKSGNILATAGTMKSGDSSGYIHNVTIPYGTKSDKEELKPKIIDLLNAFNNVGDFSSSWGIYNNNNKSGNLIDVASTNYKLPNGNKAVSASNKNYVMNDKGSVVFEYEFGISGDNASIVVLKNNLNVLNLNMNYGELINSLSEASGKPLDTSSNTGRIPLDWDGNVVKPSGDIEYDGDGITWYSGVVPSGLLPKDSDSEYTYIGYDRFKNPLYYVSVQNGSDVDDVGYVFGGPVNNNNNNNNYTRFTTNFKPGEHILDIITDIGWETDNSNFKEEMYDTFSWLEDDYGIWWKADDSAPAEFNQITTDGEGNEENNYTDENSTLDTFWTETSLTDMGLEYDFFIEMYSKFFNGELISWDEQDMERDVENPEGGYTTEYYSTDHSAKFTGNQSDYRYN